MALQEAYSLELNRIITADEAYDLYWNNKLFDKHKFECIGENCSGQVTCACMDIVEQDLKQVPHFRIKDENHSKGCTYFNNLTSKVNTTETSNHIGKNNIKDKSEKFKFKRPQSHFEIMQNGDSSSKESTINKNKTKSSFYNNGNNYTSIYSISPIVNRWIKYRGEDLLEENTIEIEREISYKDLFRCVYKRDIANQGEDNYIYYGQAFIDRKKDNTGYQLTFTDKFTFKHKDKYIRPKIFIQDEVIENYFVKNMLIRKIEKIVKEKRNVCSLFIYSHPQLIKDKFINFNIDNLDLLDIRDLSFYDKIYESKPSI